MSSTEKKHTATPQAAVTCLPVPVYGADAYGHCLAGERAGWTLHDQDLPLFRAAVRDMLPLVAHVGLYKGTAPTLASLRALGVPILYPWDVQSTCDLTLAAHAIAEKALTPVVVYHEANASLPEASYVPPSDTLVSDFLGHATDTVPTGFPAETMIFGETRRRIPHVFAASAPRLTASVKSTGEEQRQQAAQQRYFQQELPRIADAVFSQFSSLSQRPYAIDKVQCVDHAEHMLVCHGPVAPLAAYAAAAVEEPVNIVQRMCEIPGPWTPPLPTHDGIVAALQLEPLEAVPPQPITLLGIEVVTAAYASLHSEDLVDALQRLVSDAPNDLHLYLGIDFLPDKEASPKARIRHEALLDAFPDAESWALSHANTITPQGAITDTTALRRDEHLPAGLQEQPEDDTPFANIHAFYARLADGAVADPFSAVNQLPKATAILQDHRETRTEIPAWQAEACTGCGNCWVYCPEAAVHAVSAPLLDLFETAILRLEKDGHVIDHLRGAVRMLEPQVKAAIKTGGISADVPEVVQTCIRAAAEQADEDLKKEYALLMTALEGIPLAAVDAAHYPFHGSALLALSIDPERCTGCMACVRQCAEDALSTVDNTPEHLAMTAETHRFLRNVPKKKAVAGASLEALMLDREARELIIGGAPEDSTFGKVALRWIAACIQNISRDPVRQHLKDLETRAAQLETALRLKLTASLDLSNADQLHDALDGVAHEDASVSALAEALRTLPSKIEVDSSLLERMASLLDRLHKQIETYTNQQPVTVIVSDNSGLARSAAYPYNPAAFPWLNVAIDAMETAQQGILLHQEQQLQEERDILEAVDAVLAEDDSPAEEALTLPPAPPLLCVLDDACDAAQQLAVILPLLRQGKPVKVLLLRTHPAPGEPGEAILEPAVLAMMQQHAFVLQSTVGHPAHCLEGIRNGMAYDGPALFHIYAPQGDMAECDWMVASRKHALFHYTPGDTLAAGLDMALNPDVNADWGEINLNEESVSLTPGDLVALQGTLAPVPSSEEYDQWQHLSAYIEIPPHERDEIRPYVWGWDAHQQPQRFIATANAVEATEKQRQCWHLLRSFIQPSLTVPQEAIQVETVEAATETPAAAEERPAPDTTIPVEPVTVPPDTEADGFVIAPWIDTPKCTTCEECVKINSEMFVYDDKKKAYLNDLSAGTYKQLVRAAEKCTEKILFPGYPADRTAKGVEKLIRRAEKIMPMPYPEAGVEAAAAPVEAPPETEATPEAEAAPAAAPASDFPDDYVAPWIDTPKCTTCEECIKINPEMFAYDSKKKAYFKDLEAGTYKQIVRAAEKCTEKIIHPGYPEDRTIKGVEKLMKRASKFMP